MSDKQLAFVVEPETFYAEEQSNMATDVYVFHYHIRIINKGEMSAQLISRHWIITDANAQVQEVRGMGVVGEQPRIEPGQSYEYTSAATLNTPYGSMRGSYYLLSDDGRRHEVAIPEMQLIARRILH